MKAVVMLPAYNEVRTIGEIIDRIKATNKNLFVVVVDDGSTDDTAIVAQQHGAHILRHPLRRGVGSAFRTGILYCINQGFDFIVNMDADGQMFPEDIPYLLRPLIDGKADVTIVTRFKFKHIAPKLPEAKRWGNKKFAKMVSRLTGFKVSDSACGFRAYTSAAARKLGLHDKFTYTQASLMELLNKNVRVLEVPRYVQAKREKGTSKISSNLFSYGTNASMIMLRTVRDHNPFLFFGLPSFITGILSLGIILFVLVRKVFYEVSILENYPWFMVGAFSLLTISVVLFVVALLADMVKRQNEKVERLWEK